jgi:hypothetical protein
MFTLAMPQAAPVVPAPALGASDALPLALGPRQSTTRTRIRLCAGLAQSGPIPPAPAPPPRVARGGGRVYSDVRPKRSKRGRRSNFASKMKKAAGASPDLRCCCRLPVCAGQQPWHPPPPRPSDQDRGGRLVLPTGHVPNRGRCAPTGAMQAETAMTMPLAAEIAQHKPTCLRNCCDRRPFIAQAPAQCAISTGRVVFARMWLVAPPNIICRNRLWV